MKGCSGISKAAGRRARVLRIGIVGCGKVADDHAEQISRISDCRIVGVCDTEPLMARQLWQRFPISKHFDRLDAMLAETKPDVVHITTPPRSHLIIARTCLEAGCHVLVEKPLGVDETETRELLELAQARNRKVTVGHDHQFRPAARRAREMIRAGFLGGPPVHMESYYCYELNRGSYSAALLSDRNHWVRTLPGGLLQNVISHGIAPIAEYLSSEPKTVLVHGFVSPLLRDFGETELIDELRVIIGEENGATYYFTFSSQMRPALHHVRAFGRLNGLCYDEDDETVLELPGRRLVSYLQKFVPPLSLARQGISNSATNVRRFLKKDFHMKGGMRHLFESFYDSIVREQPVPIPYREILLTAHVMDRIFNQLRTADVSAREGVR
jgi:predicted dehydrogenase